MATVKTDSAGSSTPTQRGKDGGSEDVPRGGDRSVDRARPDRSDPAFVPQSGQFFLHDLRQGRGNRGGGRQAEDDGRNRFV